MRYIGSLFEDAFERLALCRTRKMKDACVYYLHCEMKHCLSLKQMKEHCGGNNSCRFFISTEGGQHIVRSPTCK